MLCLGCKLLELEHLADNGGIAASAVVAGNELVGIGVAVLGGIVKGLHLLVDGTHIVLVQGDVICLGISLKCGKLLEEVLGVVHEIIVPGVIFLAGHGAGLLIKRLCRIQTYQGGVVTVAVYQVHVLRIIDIIALGNGKAAAAGLYAELLACVVFNGDAGEVSVKCAGIKVDDKGKKDGDGYGDGSPLNLFLFLFLLLFLGSKGLSVRADDAGGLAVSFFG